MFKIVDEQGNVFSRYYYAKEAEFENMVVAHKTNIFGAKGIYFNIKKKIGVAKKERRYLTDTISISLSIRSPSCIWWRLSSTATMFMGISESRFYASVSLRKQTNTKSKVCFWQR